MAELFEFDALFSQRCFPGQQGGMSGAWGKAQIAYLPHAKARWRRPKKSTRATLQVHTSQAVAGGQELHRTIQLQKRPVILNGLVACF